MLHPYQCLAICGDVLLAASGPRIESFSLHDGSHVSSWICPPPATSIIGGQPLSPKIDTVPALDSISAPPAKKRRLSNSVEKRETAELASEHTKQTSRAIQASDGIGTSLPVVISLCSTGSGRHVIAVTDDDKSIRVFEHQGKGLLKQFSQRSMPKRPCAIALTVDQSTIIFADKFGDVYAIPLLIDDISVHSEGSVKPESSPLSNAPKPFISAANHLTVHSARNRRALQNQLRQNQNKEKNEKDFQHELLLGHVSMLTDLASVENGTRTYVVTADRDEHIRISRGIPQAHVIEGFCLGHAKFVSCLCFPSSYPDLLISGGGDDELCIWRWLSGELLCRVDVSRHVKAVMSNLSSWRDEGAGNEQLAPSEPPKVAVSKICHIQAGRDSLADFIIVTSEGVPAIFWFSLTTQGHLVHVQTNTLDGNPLDVVPASSGRVIVSVDFVHEPGSISECRNDVDISVNALKEFRMDDSNWIEGGLGFKALHQQEPFSKITRDDALAGLPNLLYGVENLRKRGGDE